MKSELNSGLEKLKPIFTFVYFTLYNLTSSHLGCVHKKKGCIRHLLLLAQLSWTLEGCKSTCYCPQWEHKGKIIIIKIIIEPSHAAPYKKNIVEISRSNWSITDILYWLIRCLMCQYGNFFFFSIKDEHADVCSSLKCLCIF